MTLPNGLVHRNERWMYRRGRPNRVAAMLNRGWALLGSLGVGPRRLVTLEVRGRRSGRPISFPLIEADLDGERYLVSMLGERAAWVANVRAANGSAVLRRGHRTAVVLEEVSPDARAPILRRHLQVAPAARSFVPVDHRAPLAAFEPIAGQFPVFRIRALGTPVPADDPAGREAAPGEGNPA